MKSPTSGRLATLLGAAITVVVLAGCGSGAATDAFPTAASATDPISVATPVDMLAEDDQIAMAGPDAMEPYSMNVDTYDGSGQMVHPDALVVPHGWRGGHFWFAGTPYPQGNSAFENPSLYYGEGPTEWRVPGGVRNPLAQADGGGYLSDPDIAMDPVKGELRMYYRQTVGNVDQVYLITSDDGTHWGEPARVVEDGRYSIISPSVVREADGTWRMWSVDARPFGCSSRGSSVKLGWRTSADGRTWGGVTPVTLTIPGRVPWHWDVQYIRARDEYWALVAAYRDGGTCSESSVYLARSADGTTWRASPTPLLTPGVVPRLNDIVYRSTFRYFSKTEVVDVWFSGARMEDNAFRYGLASARYKVADLLARVERPFEPSTARTATRSMSPVEASARAAFAKDFP